MEDQATQQLTERVTDLNIEDITTQRCDECDFDQLTKGEQLQKFLDIGFENRDLPREFFDEPAKTEEGRAGKTTGQRTKFCLYIIRLKVKTFRIPLSLDEKRLIRQLKHLDPPKGSSKGSSHIKQNLQFMDLCVCGHSAPQENEYPGQTHEYGTTEPPAKYYKLIGEWCSEECVTSLVVEGLCKAPYDSPKKSRFLDNDVLSEEEGELRTNLRRGLIDAAYDSSQSYFKNNDSEIYLDETQTRLWGEWIERGYEFGCRPPPPEAQFENEDSWARRIGRECFWETVKEQHPSWAEPISEDIGTSQASGQHSSLCSCKLA